MVRTTPTPVGGGLRHFAPLPPANFRATMQGFLLPANFLITIGHGLNGLWTLQLGKFYLFSLPAVFCRIVCWQPAQSQI
ncbi:MAG: hypothetical protein R3C26_03905 [Calditrichia bacterium]